MESEPYIFYDQTTSLCEMCETLVPAKIIIENKNVFYLKHCLTHGEQKTLISTDVDYYKKSRDIQYVKKKNFGIKNQIEKGCPYDCGLCIDHEQHTAMAIVEIIDDCNLHCHTCIAGSHPGAGNVKTVNEVAGMLEALITSDSDSDLVMISGGEPTIHPQFLEIIKIACEMPFKRVMLITNGVKIANEIDLVERLALYKEKLEIYLQFDSLNSGVLFNIRGQDLRDIRIKSVENLEKFGLHSTLICVVKKSLNEFDMGNVIEFALQHKFIRGVTFQPCKITGRNDSFSKQKNYITLSEVRKNIIDTSQLITESNFIPHPLNPENISIAYLIKENEELLPITNHLYYSQYSAHKYKNPFPHADRFKQLMYFLPFLNTETIKYENLFRVAVVSFLDKFNFCTTAVKRSCIHFVTQKHESIPIDTYYLFHQK